MVQKNFMTSSRNNLLKLSVGLVLISVALYVVNFLVTGRWSDVLSGFLSNLAFLPIYVLFVTLMIEQIMKRHERAAIRQKLNMVIGIFFSEVGQGLLCDMWAFVANPEELRPRLMVTDEWEEKDFRRANDFCRRHEVEISCCGSEIVKLKAFLQSKRDFLLTLLENPNLLEHDRFTDLLWAIVHLLEELQARQDLAGLPETDMNHLAGDLRRVYGHLMREWIFYMKHLKRHYPYLFSLAVRMSPMNPQASPYITT